MTLTEALAESPVRPYNRSRYARVSVGDDLYVVKEDREGARKAERYRGGGEKEIVGIDQVPEEGWEPLAPLG